MVVNNNAWKNWLNPDHGKYLLEIRSAITAIHNQNHDNEPLAFYTPHGPKHFEMVEDNFHKLIPDDDATRHLEEEERFYLLASAWLHDIGMYRSVAREVWQSDLDDNEIRERHHITSAKYLVSNFTCCGVKEIDKDFLATLCLYHRRIEDIDECPTQKSVGVDNKSFKLKLLAAYLRLADSLDIGPSRTPTPAYAICLAYNIPQESKIHWIKSRIISGIFIDPASHRITVEFNEPKFDNGYSSNTKNTVFGKLDYVIDLVMKDLNEELNSVKQILISNGVAFFLDIDSKKNKEFLSEQTVKDLIELVANYDILVHPSASRLLEMILLTIANIGGFHLQKDFEPEILKGNVTDNPKKMKDELDLFLTKISKELVQTRPCHYGLRKLIDQCSEIARQTLDDTRYGDFVTEIATLYSKHHKYRRDVRKQSKDLFAHLYEDKKEKNEYAILLYGYSELAIKAICGFRDAILSKEYPAIKASDLYNTDVENNISKCIKLFICDGQPKAISNGQDGLVYHDGLRYAESIADRNFYNVIIIPDATVGNIIKNIDIDLIVVGANGYDNESFVHSSGHSSIINLGLYHKIITKNKSPLIVLATTQEKYIVKKDEVGGKDESTSKTLKSNDGSITYYKDDHIEGREKVWFVYNSKLLHQKCRQQTYC